MDAITPSELKRFMSWGVKCWACSTRGRRSRDGKNPDGWYPDEKITVEEALRCYTYNSAYAGFQEDKLGTLETGKLADFVVLSKDLLVINPDDILETKVVRTVVGGKDVYVLPEIKDRTWH